MSREGTVTGSCFCGAVRFSVTLPTTSCVHCHCTVCQRVHGVGYVTWFVVERKQFSLDAGSEDLVRFQSSEHGSRSFCGKCGSSILCDNTSHPDVIDITLANMHDPIDRDPQLHIFFDDRADWITTDDALPRLGGSTGLEPIKNDGA